ncbi:MAG TPA: M50 family metallopeptidase [Solirubrobacterales bacterium]|nr:M50 family metallopeptidase [Solirubrobacterales bacterium]
MSWLLAFAGFAVLIILHEFGHFIVAKWTGMRVERFFLFFPPKVWSFKRGETEYGIGAIPAGGFVKITGMNPDDLEPKPPKREGPEEEGDTPNDLLNRIESAGQNPSDDRLPDGRLKPEIVDRAYYNQPVWKRIVVIAAGPAVNVLIAFAIFFGLAFGAEEITGPTLEIEAISSESPAEGKLQEGDKVVSIDGVAAANLEGDDRADEFRDQTNTHTCPQGEENGCSASSPVTVVVERDGRRVTELVTPKYDQEADRMLMGVQFDPTDVSPVNPSMLEAADTAIGQMWIITRETAKIPAKLIDPQQREQIGSVVGGYETTRQAIDFDAELAIFILGLISLSLAIINLFPFLPLDGGHIFWSVVEKLRGERVPFSVMERSGAIGFVLILMLFFIGLSNDIDRISGEGFGVR